MNTVNVTDYLNSTYDVSLASQETASNELGRDEFLELLIAQLEWQDPLEPVENSEMVAQLAEFSSLEQMENMNAQMENLTAQMATQISMSATSYLGQEVEAAGSAMSKDGDEISTVSYTLSEDAATVYAHVINEAGEIVESVELGAQEAGEYTFSWDGEDAGGNEAEDGQYAIAFVAENEHGESFYVTTQVSGTVTSVYQENGNTMLGLSDGRSVNLLNVGKVVDTSASTQADAEAA